MMADTAHRYHPLAAVRIFRKNLWLLLAPLLRPLLLLELDALWLALYQDAALLCVIFGYTFLVWRRSSWRFLLSAPHPILQLRRGVLLQQTICLNGQKLALICVEGGLFLRLVHARRVVLCYQTPAHPHSRSPQQLRFIVTPADADALAAQLTQSNATTRVARTRHRGARPPRS